MTREEKSEKIKAVEEQMAKLQKELEDIRNTKVQEWDFSAWDNIPLRKRYEFDIPVDSVGITLFDKQFDVLKKLIKFKFCYDYSYIPDWSNKNELKWWVFFDTTYGKYKFDWTATWNRPLTVYFSSLEVAQKCADWLNADCPEE